MLFFLLSLQGSWEEWYGNFIHIAASRGTGAVMIIEGDVADSLERCRAVPPEQTAFVFSHRPSLMLSELIAETDRPYAIILRDPRDCVVELIDKQGLAFGDALRVVSNECAALTPLIESPAAIVLHDRLLKNDPAMVNIVAQLLGLAAPVFDPAVSRDRIRQATQRLLDEAHGSGDDFGNLWRNRLTEEQQRLSEGALSAYASFFTGGALGEIVWKNALFFLGDAPGVKAVEPVDITGRMRCLVYGPYICLPPGKWSATILMAIADDAIAEEFHIEACLMEVVSYRSLRPGEAGIFNVDLIFDVPNAQTPIEIRLFNKKGSFEGHILFGGTVFSRQ